MLEDYFRQYGLLALFSIIAVLVPIGMLAVSYMSTFFRPDLYTGFRFNDPLFSVKWPKQPAFISDKDLNFNDFDPATIKSV